MKKDKDKAYCFKEDIELEAFNSASPDKFKKGKMSKAFEAALDAVENMGKESKN